MDVLALCDDYWHPARTAKTGLAPLADDGFRFDFVEDAYDWSAAKIAAYPVVLFTKANNMCAADTTEWITDEAQQAFLNYVRAGGGLLVVYSGTVSYAETPVLNALIGGVFGHHSPQRPVTVNPDPAHPLSVGSEPSTLQDEQYHMAFDQVDGDAHLFMTSHSEYRMQPAGLDAQRRRRPRLRTDAGSQCGTVAAPAVPNSDHECTALVCRVVHDTRRRRNRLY